MSATNGGIFCCFLHVFFAAKKCSTALLPDVFFWALLNLLYLGLSPFPGFQWQVFRFIGILY